MEATGTVQAAEAALTVSPGIIFMFALAAVLSALTLLAVVVVFLLAVWRTMKAHESIAEAVGTLALEMGHRNDDARQSSA